MPFWACDGSIESTKVDAAQGVLSPQLSYLCQNVLTFGRSKRCRLMYSARACVGLGLGNVTRSDET